jgi:hypothetical protein
MMLVGAAIIGFLVGLIVCYWKQLKSAYDHREEIGAVGDIATGISGVQTLYRKL